MIKFYTNKELSQAFNINLAKWKRWSREFLPPDPLGGLQSGVARQYNLDEVFTVFLGGHLVAVLKFTIPESRQIIHDLNQWLLDHGFYFDFSGNANPQNPPIHPVRSYQIAIYSINNPADNYPGLKYRLEATFASDAVNYDGVRIHPKRFIETSLKGPAPDPEQLRAESYRVLNISGLRNFFLAYFQTRS